MRIGGLDIETTGLDYDKGHRIIEVCQITYEGDVTTGFQEVQRWTQRIDPQRSIESKAQAVHGISVEELAGCPYWQDVAKKLLDMINSCDLVVAHNGDGFDFPFIAHELNRLKFEAPTVQTYDTMLQGRHATQWGKLPALKEYCWAFDVDYDEAKAHAAEYDVEVMMQAFFRALSLGYAEIDLGDAEQEKAA